MVENHQTYTNSCKEAPSITSTRWFFHRAASIPASSFDSSTHVFVEVFLKCFSLHPENSLLGVDSSPGVHLHNQDEIDPHPKIFPRTTPLETPFPLLPIGAHLLGLSSTKGKQKEGPVFPLDLKFRQRWKLETMGFSLFSTEMRKVLSYLEPLPSPAMSCSPFTQ